MYEHGQSMNTKEVTHVKKERDATLIPLFNYIRFTLWSYVVVYSIKYFLFTIHAYNSL